MRSVNQCENVEVKLRHEWEPMNLAKHEGSDVSREISLHVAAAFRTE